MSDSENESAGGKGSHQKVKKSKSNSTFKSEVGEVENDMSLLKKCPTLLTAEELTSSEYEAWMISTPNRLDAETIRNLEFSLSKTTKLKIEEERYETVVQQKADTITFLLPDKNGVIKTVARETMGIISFVKDLKFKATQNEITNLPAKKSVVPPTGLKIRHPLYGDKLEDVLAQARGEKRPKPVERGLKKSPKKPKQEITDDNQHKEEKKKKKQKN
ncbi:hypothetical protein DAPPUDRAFT_311457 [Daphnia pulex]|uniref:Uncharacterized protein n=1 Tax=Daphnia pulex TaxID=6669 RepID=E9FWY5_DAPPU|nr:hypothetical protein DAPPUDRAFT_311457 [Daphnia pulex]|eukprot:EFX88354.1 hypothetical protein DAPPUDRAFT_311457 [Daphnia pulex]